MAHLDRTSAGAGPVAIPRIPSGQSSIRKRRSKRGWSVREHSERTRCVVQCGMIACICVALSAACAASPEPSAVGVLLAIDAEEGVRTSAKVMDVLVAGASRSEGFEDPSEREFDMDADGESQWPLRIAIVPKGGDPERTWRLRLRVFDITRTVVVERWQDGSFPHGRVGYMSVTLEDSCISESCDLGAIGTCVHGLCVEEPFAQGDSLASQQEASDQEPDL